MASESIEVRSLREEVGRLRSENEALRAERKDDVSRARYSMSEDAMWERADLAASHAAALETLREELRAAKRAWAEEREREGAAAAAAHAEAEHEAERVAAAARGHESAATTASAALALAIAERNAARALAADAKRRCAQWKNEAARCSAALLSMRALLRGTLELERAELERAAVGGGATQDSV
jgi:hypothetical protein